MKYSDMRSAMNISTPRLTLTPYYAGMVTGRHVAWLNDPEVVKYSEQRHRVHTIESCHKYVNDLWTSSGSKIWAIISDDTVIGTITAHTDHHNMVCDMGILIGDKKFWHGGFGTEAWLAVQNWIVDKDNVRKVEAGCHAQNKPMRKLAERCGLRLEGVRHNHFLVDGEPQHLLLYAKEFGLTQHSE